MRPTPKIIKSTKFEDGTYAIKAPVHPLPMIEPDESLAGPLEDPLRLAAEAESREVLARAREEAEAALADAEAALVAREQEWQARLEQEREQVLAAARQEGFGLGLAEGRVSGEQLVMDEHASALTTLHLAIEQAAAERNGWFEQQQKDLVKLAILIAQKIMLVELAHTRESVVKMAEAAIKHVTDKTHVRVRVHPGDLPRLHEARGALTLAVDNLTSLELIGDPVVGVGGCLIDTRTGTVDARLATQLAEVAAALLDIAPGPDGASDLDPMIVAAVRALGQGGHVLAAAPQAAPAWQRPTAPAVPAPAPAPAPAASLATPAPVAPVAPAPAPVAAPVEAYHAVPAAEPTADAEEPAYAPPQPYAAEPVVVPAAPAAPAPELFAPQALPEVAASVPEAPARELPRFGTAPAPQAPAPEAPKAHPNYDPSRRAADALAARLGQLKKGRGVTTLSEEYDMTLLEGAMKDEDLEAIVRQTSRNVIATEIGGDQVLVHNPFALEDAADALAERLGKPRKKRTDDAQLGDVLGDTKIDEIMGTLMPRVGGDAPVEEQPEQPNIDRASENLAKLLGKTKKKSNRAWYDQ